MCFKMFLVQVVLAPSNAPATLVLRMDDKLLPVERVAQVLLFRDVGEK